MKKTIAHFIDTEGQGGAEVMLLHLCQGLLNSDQYSPLVLHFNNPYLQTACASLGIRCLSVPGHKYYKSTKTLPLFALQLSRFLRQQRIDLLHSHLFGPVTGAALGAWFARRPHLGTLHDIYMIEEKPARIHLLEWAVRLKTQLVAVSQQMLHFYQNRGGFKAQQLRCIHNGVDLPAVEQSTQALRAGLKLNETDTVFICVGRLVPLKRHTLLINAFCELNRRLKQPSPAEPSPTAPPPTESTWKLLIVGDGPEKTNLAAQIQQAQLDDQILLLGQRHDVADLLRMSDVFMLASSTEGLSCSILEALAASLPCVVSKVGGNPELVHDRYNGYLLESSDANAYADKVQLLLESPSLRARFAKASLQSWQANFSLAGMLRQYEQAYGQLLSPGKTKSSKAKLAD